MYELAKAKISRGLSFGARLVLGLVATIFVVVMFLAAPASTDPKAWVSYAFGVFCFLIAVACFTSGRVRQFIGSIIGCTIFLGGVAYLASEMYRGVLWSGSRASPSAINAADFLWLIGIPGVAYAYKVRFGFNKRA